jgi:hypothetical protein
VLSCHFFFRNADPDSCIFSSPEATESQISLDDARSLLDRTLLERLSGNTSSNLFDYLISSYQRFQDLSRYIQKEKVGDYILLLSPFFLGDFFH